MAAQSHLVLKHHQLSEERLRLLRRDLLGQPVGSVRRVGPVLVGRAVAVAAAGTVLGQDLLDGEKLATNGPPLLTRGARARAIPRRELYNVRHETSLYSEVSEVRYSILREFC